MTPLLDEDRLSEPADAIPALEPNEYRSVVAPLARSIAAHAVALGVAADLLLRDGPMGIAWPLWLAIGALGALSLVWRAGRRLPSEARAWLLTSILFGAGLAWRDADRLLAFDFLASLFALGMAAIALADPRLALGAARLRDTLWAGVAVIRSMLKGFAPLALRDMDIGEVGDEMSMRVRPGLRAAAIALPLLVVFGALLRGADPVFASFVDLPELDLGEFVSHLAVIGVFAWLSAGWARGALITGVSSARAPEHPPFSLGLLDVSAALGTLVGLFALYLVTQLGWFFGGEEFLQARTGLTAAEYARQGFFQMVWVVVLVVPVLLTTRAALRPGRELERRHTALALPTIALLGAMIVSAVLRMRLYVHYYGLTLDRFYPLVFMAWLGVVLLWLAVTVLRGRGRSFVAGAVLTGLTTLALLNVVVPDVIVARVNLARAERGGPAGAASLDLEHLSSLGGEAVPLVIPAVVAAPTASGAAGAGPASAGGRTERTPAEQRCIAATRLLGRAGLWSPRDEASDAGSWRRWNRGEAVARQAVQARLGALLAARRESCPRRPRPAVAAPSASR